jgi:glucokinase
MTSGSTHHLGIDLGGTNCKWAVVEHDAATDAWRVLGRGQAPTLAEEGPDAVIGRLVGIGRDALARWSGIATVGIGVPGLYDPTTGTTRALINLPGGWPGVPLAGPVATALGRPAALINDARAFGLAELRLGAGRGAASMVGLVLGTGVGGVIAIDGRVHLGHDGTAGEIGHQTLDPDGPSCNCGNHGCLESFARADRLAEACGAESVEAAVLAARAGDPTARAGFERVGGYLGRGIANMITVISPDVVVIGGGIAAAGELLLAPIRAELGRRVWTTSLDAVRLTTAELGTWAGAIGAAVHGAEAAGDGQAQRPGAAA